MKYSAQLRDRRWQRKRLGILKRDKWRCQNPSCKKPDSDEVMLVVHHRVYHKGKKAAPTARHPSAQGNALGLGIAKHFAA